VAAVPIASKKREREKRRETRCLNSASLVEKKAYKFHI
jgi:hypothetical protein